MPSWTKPYTSSARCMHRLAPYEYLLSGRTRWLDIFGFSTALTVAQTAVASSGDYVRDKYGYEPATWPPIPEKEVEGAREGINI